MRNLPSLLSLSRLAAAFFIALAYFLGPHWQAVLLLFLWSGLSDFLDGWIARRYELSTPFGAWLDHLSDKVVVLTTLTILSWRIDMLAMPVCTLLTLNREILALGIRAYPALESTESIKVSMLGKMKTMLQFGSIFFLLLSQIARAQEALLQIGLLLLVLATGMGYLSLVGYWGAFCRQWPRLPVSKQ